MKLRKLLILASLFVSCNSQTKKADKKASPEAETKTPSAINCYRYASATDTILLKVIHIGNSVTGTLVYSLKEKDKNKGTIQGNMNGNILIADYTFMSEGTQSIRQVAFKKEGNSFVEGYGDFKNSDSLNFNTSMKLAEFDCQ